jgi:alkylated DNA repair dioxygenase AlkB
MQTLFSVPLKFPEGFIYHEDFISAEEENLLIERVAKIPLCPMIFHGFEAKRKVASFGFDYHFESRRLSKGLNFPDGFKWLIDKVSNHTGLAQQRFKELLFTEYPAGSVINWHRDAPPFETIVGISLASDCIFRLRPHDPSERKRSKVISFPVNRRSLYMIQGDARTNWQHSIAPVDALRHSITLRTLIEN